MRKLVVGFAAMAALLVGQVVMDKAYAAETAPAVEAVKEELPSLKDKAAEVLNSLLDTALATKDFLVEQVPIVIQELLTYYTALYAVAVLLGVGLLVLALCTWKYFTKKIRAINKYNIDKSYEERIDDDGWHVVRVFGTGVPIIVAIILLAEYVPDLLKITLAPRIWLLEYARNLI